MGKPQYFSRYEINFIIALGLFIIYSHYSSIRAWNPASGREQQLLSLYQLQKLETLAFISRKNECRIFIVLSLYSSDMDTIQIFCIFIIDYFSMSSVHILFYAANDALIFSRFQNSHRSRQYSRCYKTSHCRSIAYIAPLSCNVLIYVGASLAVLLNL